MEGEIVSDKKPTWSFVLFIISFIPYVGIVIGSIFGVSFFFSESYGFEAAFVVLLAGTVGFPIYPIVLLFQILYLILKGKFFTKLQKKITKWVICVLLLAIVVPSTINSIKNYREEKTINEKSYNTVEKYLKNTFGDLADDMEIGTHTFAGDEYSIKTPLLKENFRVQLNDEKSNVTGNDFYEKYATEKNLNKKMSDRFKERFDLPSYYEPVVEIRKFDLKYIDNEDELLDNSIYVLKHFILNISNFDKDETVKIIVDYYDKYHETIKSYFQTVTGEFVIKPSNYTSVSISTNKETSRKLRIDFYIYEDKKDSYIKVIYDTFENKVIVDEKVR